MSKYCKHCFTHTEFVASKIVNDWGKESSIGERQVTFHCDRYDMAQIALASGEDGIEFKMWLGDNFVDIDKCNPQDCEYYESEEED